MEASANSDLARARAAQVRVSGNIPVSVNYRKSEAPPVG